MFWLYNFIFRKIEFLYMMMALVVFLYKTNNYIYKSNYLFICWAKIVKHLNILG